MCLLLLPSLREVREVETCSYRSLIFRVTGARANLGPVMRFFLLPGRRRDAAAAALADGTGRDAGTER